MRQSKHIFTQSFTLCITDVNYVLNHCFWQVIILHLNFKLCYLLLNCGCYYIKDDYQHVYCLFTLSVLPMLDPVVKYHKLIDFYCATLGVSAVLAFIRLSLSHSCNASKRQRKLSNFTGMIFLSYIVFEPIRRCKIPGEPPQRRR